MIAYICKCGKVVEKSTQADTTGNRLENYGPGHLCYGCPYVLPVKNNRYDEELKGWTFDVRGYECRMSKNIRYASYASLALGSKNTGSVYSLDFDFLRKIQEFCRETEGLSCDRNDPGEHSSQYGSDGLYRLPIYPDQNKKGIEGKRLLFARFFSDDGERMDVSPEGEKDLILRRIQESIDDAAAENEEREEKLTDEEYVLENDFSDTNDEQRDSDNILPESDMETEECDLQSQEEDTTPDDESELTEETAAEEEKPAVISGQRVSLRDQVFDEIVSACDAKINSALRTMLESHQRKFDFTAKITFESQGQEISVTHETGYKFEPINYKEKQTLYEPVRIVLDEAGQPVIPYDRQHQLTFDELAENQPQAEVTTDSSGMVESIVFEDVLQSPVPAEEDIPVDAELQVSCQQEICDFYDIDSPRCCCFQAEAPNYGCGIFTDAASIKEAVEDLSCTNPDVINEYNKLQNQEE